MLHLLPYIFTCFVHEEGGDLPAVLFGCAMHGEDSGGNLVASFNGVDEVGFGMPVDKELGIFAISVGWDADDHSVC